MPTNINQTFQFPDTPLNDQGTAEFGANLSDHSLNEQFDNIATNLEFNKIVQHNYPDRNDKITDERSRLEKIFNPEPAKQASDHNGEQASAYVMQEADLLEAFRVERMNR